MNIFNKRSRPCPLLLTPCPPFPSSHSLHTLCSTAPHSFPIPTHAAPWTLPLHLTHHSHIRSSRPDSHASPPGRLHTGGMCLLFPRDPQLLSQQLQEHKPPVSPGGLPGGRDADFNSRSSAWHRGSHRISTETPPKKSSRHSEPCPSL